MTCHDRRPDIGAYVVGALEPAERARLEEHLAGCPQCRDELADLAGLPGLLGHLTASEVELGPPSPSAGALDRMLAAFADRRRAERRRRVLAAVAAVVVLVGGASAAGALLGRGSSPAPAAKAVATATATDPRTHVAATAWLRPTTWGTAVQLRLSGVPSDAHCKLVAVAKDGHTEQAGSWEATYTGTADVTGAVSVSPADLVRLDVVTFAGDRLVSVPVSHGAGGNATTG